MMWSLKLCLFTCFWIDIIKNMHSSKSYIEASYAVMSKDQIKLALFFSFSFLLGDSYYPRKVKWWRKRLLFTFCSVGINELLLLSTPFVFVWQQRLEDRATLEKDIPWFRRYVSPSLSSVSFLILLCFHRNSNKITL